jgi:predicted nucleic acid-binding protein
VQDFLLDVNHITALFHKDERIVQKVRSKPHERKLIIGKTVRGELIGGHEMSPTADQAKIDEFWDFVNEHFFAIEELETFDHVSQKYGEIIGRLHAKYPRTTDKHNQAWLTRIGVQLNDVWLVAEAWTYNIVCATNDDMEKIVEVMDDDVRFENWLKN